MNFIKRFLIFTILCCSGSSFAQWTELNTIDSNVIQKLNFIDDNLGYTIMHEVLGPDVTIEKTIDGGANWIEINKPVSGGTLQDIHFYASGEGVAVVKDLSNNTVPTKIYQTLDDGANWNDISPDTTESGIGTGLCQFLDQNTGFLATDNVLYTTLDGGSNWNAFPLNGSAISMDFLNSNYGTIGTFDGTFNYFGGMLTTTDGGQTWADVMLSEHNSVIGKVRQIDTSFAYAAPVKWGAFEKLKFFRSTDNGVSWDSIQVPSDLENAVLSEMDFKDKLNGSVVVSGIDIRYIYKTEDGGMTWSFQDSIQANNISDFQLTENSGYLSGDRLALFKLTGGTSSFRELINVEVDLYPNPIQGGQIVKWSSTETFSDLVLFDITGKIIHQQSLDQANAVLPELTPGIYIIQFQNKEKLKSKRLIVK